MKEIVEPLGQLPGVRLAALVMSDGVPIVCPGRAGARRAEGAAAHSEAVDLDVAAALGASWMEELARTVGPLSFAPPQRAILRAARGSLILRRCEDVLLLVVLDSGLDPLELHLPIEAAAARMQRLRRQLSAETEVQAPLPAASPAAVGSSTPAPEHQAP